MIIVLTECTRHVAHERDLLKKTKAGESNNNDLAEVENESRRIRSLNMVSII